MTMPILRKRIKWKRNWPCLCGSGKKYKRCCLNEIVDMTAFDGNAKVEKLPEDIQKIIDIQRDRQSKGGINKYE